MFKNFFHDFVLQCLNKRIWREMFQVLWFEESENKNENLKIKSLIIEDQDCKIRRSLLPQPIGLLAQHGALSSLADWSWICMFPFYQISLFFFFISFHFAKKNWQEFPGEFWLNFAGKWKKLGKKVIHILHYSQLMKIIFPFYVLWNQNRVL